MVFWIALCLMLLVVLHELGHVACARLLNKRVSGYGVCMRPVPHFFVTVGGELRKGETFLYLLSGVSVIVLLSALLLPLYAHCSAVRMAIALQLLLDTNPLYSDVALVFHKLMAGWGWQEPTLATLSTGYYYSWVWYLHLIVWLVCIVLMFK